MADDRRSIFFHILTHNTVGAVRRLDQTAADSMRELARRASGPVQSGPGPESLGTWTIKTGTLPGGVRLCADASTGIGICDPHASSSAVAAAAGRHFGIAPSAVSVERVDPEALVAFLTAMGAADTSNAELVRAADAWRASFKTADASDTTGASEAPRVMAHKRTARTLDAALDIAAALAAVNALASGIGRQIATAYTVNPDNGVRGELAIIGRKLAAVLSSLDNITSRATTYPLRAAVVKGARVTGKRLDGAGEASGIVRRASPGFVALCRTDDDGMPVLLDVGSTVAELDATAVNDTLSLWGFALPEAPDTTGSGESSGSIDPLNIGAPPTLDSIAALEARADADTASDPTLDTANAPDTSKRGAK